MSQLGDLIDWNKGIVFQMPKLGSKYEEWLHDTAGRREDMAKHNVKSIRMFDPNWMEALTFTRWYVIPMVWWPIAAAHIYVGMYFLATPQMTSTLPFIAAFGAGVLFWSWLEYFLHRYVFHFIPPHPFGNVLHFILHGVHHLVPGDPLRLVFPPVAAAVLAVIVESILLTVLPLPSAYITVLFAGTIVGYTFYDMIHYNLHHDPKTPFKGQRDRHRRHHFIDECRDYGISSPLWDFVYRTRGRGRAAAPAAKGG